VSVSIYYTARRSRSINDAEQVAIDALVSEYSADSRIERYLRTGMGLNWASFCIYQRLLGQMADVVFDGATKLPDNSEDGLWEGVRHWSELLSRIRRVLRDAQWRVSVDDHELVWDDERGEYDLQR